MASKRSPTMSDVARRANVSQATVSYVLNNVTAHKIPDETRRAVWDAARELDYRPNLAARDLVTGTSSVVVLVVPPIPLSEPVVSLVGELTGAFAAEGVVMAVHFETMGDESLASMRRALNPRKVFSLFPGVSGVDIDLVDMSEYATDVGSWLQVDHLVECGHTRLAFAASAEPELRQQSDARHLATVRGAEDRGLPAVVADTVRRDAKGVADTVRRWRDEGVTAVCANNDEVALAVIRGCEIAGIRVPEDLSVIGYDASVIGASSTSPLTSVGWRVRGLESLVKRVIFGSALDAGALPDPLDVWLVERSSVARR